MSPGLTSSTAVHCKSVDPMTDPAPTAAADIATQRARNQFGLSEAYYNAMQRVGMERTNEVRDVFVAFDPHRRIVPFERVPDYIAALDALQPAPRLVDRLARAGFDPLRAAADSAVCTDTTPRVILAEDDEPDMLALVAELLDFCDTPMTSYEWFADLTQRVAILRPLVAVAREG